MQFVRGVGPERAKLLAKLELKTVRDVLWNLPRDVLDLTEVRAVSELKENELQTVRGVVVDVDSRILSRGRTLSVVLIDCDGDYVRGIWFNQKWVLQKFHHGEAVLFSAKPKRRSGRWEFSHPRIHWLEDDDPLAHGGILPRYRLTEGLKMHEVRRIVRDTVELYAELVPEYLPETFRRPHHLPQIGQAIKQLHFPASKDQYESGRHRLIYDDLLEFQLGLALRRRSWKQHDQAPVLPTTAKIAARIRRLFPFSFTEGQNQAVREISADLVESRAMHRLLQADVGGGKTAVAMYGMLVAIAAGFQAVLMTPTEVLAMQHWATAEQALGHSRVNRLLLTGALTSAQRKQALAEIRNGDVQLIVGTQAVIQKDVDFNRLGLVIIDEQHKFGVAQRAHFSTGALSPHILVMTATPIPRSLCLTQFGDLDITTIRDMPPSRQQVVTNRVTGVQPRKRAWNFVRKQLLGGRQAYIVCPRVEETTEGTGNDLIASAEKVYRDLVSGGFRDFNVGLVHGQMDRLLKAKVMDSFREGRTQALVSTTVVEVGVDVPNATLMIVMQAERFGLSQLHQLRGRISRGKFQGYCFLFSDADSPEGVQRLAALESTSDGFKIAEMDFKLRGPGDVLGTRQHGQLPLRVADLVRDHDILIDARRAAFKLVDSGEFDEPHFAPLKIRVLERFGRLMDLPQSG